MVVPFQHRAVLVKVTQFGSTEVSARILYDAAHAWWRVAARRREGPEAVEVALAVRDNAVVGAWWIDEWTPDEGGARWSFEGREDPELDRLYDGLDVTPWFPRGAQNPLRYVGPDGAAEQDDPLDDVDGAAVQGHPGAARATFGSFDEALEEFGMPVENRVRLREIAAGLSFTEVWIPPARSYVAVGTPGTPAAAYFGAGYVSIYRGPNDYEVVELPNFRGGPRRGGQADAFRRLEERVFGTCPTCHTQLPANGRCDTCDD
ncbi:Uncharacterised protein [Mycobacteroides abscessus]|jgi:hypothetical protein|nr:Uncharacterised protein [Mycobacteroides abscessus]